MSPHLEPRSLSPPELELILPNGWGSAGMLRITMRGQSVSVRLAPRLVSITQHLREKWLRDAALDRDTRGWLNLSALTRARRRDGDINANRNHSQYLSQLRALLAAKCAEIGCTVDILESGEFGWRLPHALIVRDASAGGAAAAVAP